MSRQSWNRIKQSKSFYVMTYRRALKFLLLSMALNVFICVAISYVYLNRPERTFYASSGITPPIKLTPLATPNYSSRFLLSPDPVDDNEEKAIPQ
ncbi:type IVB secretion system protein IcmM/DotJ [Legionella gresilensis]|uniref:type IVB secretion system protein IcmM/DotJ n=1 Tax=Legionella gresilensis TaxID=91823 RepID=UPI00104129FA|nr:type IVB secretion system protein IcmM/DotJ [Legionella gresilensis]